MAILHQLKTTLKGYQIYSDIKGQDDTELLFINKGTVNLNAKIQLIYLQLLMTMGI